VPSASSGLLAIGAGASFVAGVALGLFGGGAQRGDADTLSTGVVSLGSPVSKTCAINAMAPGDASTGWSPAGTSATCSYQVTYSGDVPALLGLDVAITGIAGSPVTPYGGTIPRAAAGLFDGTPNGSQLVVTDDASTTFVSNTTFRNQAGSPVSLSSTSTSTVAGLLVSRTAFTNGGTETITVNFKLPMSASNAYNSASSTLVLVVDAVPAENNTLPEGCASGSVCSPGSNWP
jgi:hypothetical protein